MLEVANSQAPEVTFGTPNKSGYRILIVYASQFGTTGEVAEAIGETLSQAGHIVETRWVKDAKDIEIYDAVVIGSAIQYDHWMPEARAFLTANQMALSQIPVAYFFTCMTLSKRNQKSEQQALNYADKLHTLAPQVKPIDIGRFAGALNYNKMPFIFRVIAPVLFSIFRVKAGDYRDWDAIRAWAKSIQAKLVVEQVQIVN